MSVLLAAGSIPDGEVRGNTPLHSAVKSGKVKAVQIILDANIDVDARNTDEDTPLLDAALLGHSDIVKLLLKQGANPQLVNTFSANFLHRAVNSSNLDVVKLALKEKDSLLGSDSNGFISLHVAAHQGFTEAALKLLASGSRTKQIEARTSREHTALDLAAKYRHLEVVKLLLKAKSDINLVDSKLLTPLGLATKKGHLEVSQFLIEEGADANLVDNHGLTPLFWAFDRGNKDLVTLIQPKTHDLHQVSKH
jgi:ankyrin repeat protein